MAGDRDRARRGAGNAFPLGWLGDAVVALAKKLMVEVNMMDGCGKRIRSAFALTAMTLAALIPTAVQAQTGGFGGGFGGDTGVVAGNIQNAGVVIDAQGVLRIQRRQDPGGLHAKRIVQAAMTSLNPQLAKQSKLRKISLNRLEQAVAQQIALGQGPSDEMKYLAGLLRVNYVFFYPETGDIVLAGPAEGFAEDLVGRVRGMSTGRPVLELQDLVTALRAYPPRGDQANVIGVSIDPTSEGLERMRQFYASIAGRVGPGDAPNIAKGMRDSLGLQTVSVQGISPRTHFAQVLVEADYRMKLIGIGLEEPPVKIRTWISQANPRSVRATRCNAGTSLRTTSAFGNRKTDWRCKWRVLASSWWGKRSWSRRVAFAWGPAVKTRPVTCSVVRSRRCIPSWPTGNRSTRSCAT